MDMMIIVSLFALAIVLVVAYKGLKSKQPSDSLLRQRAVFNAEEQLTFTRLCQILPEAHIFAHVSLDALLTTKFPRTRRKYQNLFADFVVLNQECRVIAVVAFGYGSGTMKRQHSTIQQDALLEAAGYRVLRYEHVPEYQQLREDFLDDFSQLPPVLDAKATSHLGKFDMYVDPDLGKMRIYG